MGETVQPDRSLEARSQRRSLDIVRDYWELVWSQGGSPDLKELMRWAPTDQRACVFDTLLQVELRYRQDRGETPVCEDYLARFPEFAREIRAACDGGGSTMTHFARQDSTAHADETVSVDQGAKDDATHGSPEEVSPSRMASGVRYRILRPHAKGGLGEVYVAHDAELNREVALKEILPKHAGDANSRARFLLEAEVTGSLEHPGVVPVYGLGKHADGRPYYAMRFIRGQSLQEAIARFHRTHSDGDETADHSLELRQLLGRFIDVCNAIQYAHSRGVLHRDLKPGNVMLGKYGETLVVDWGLAKLKDAADESPAVREASWQPSLASGSATEFGSAVGTPAYMSPEQAAGQLDRLGPASDVYSLGATLYHVLAGRPPVTDRDLHSLLRKVQDGDFPSPRQIRKDVPAALQAICLKAMRTDASQRYMSPQDLADDVERWLADEPVLAHSEPVLHRVRGWMRKHHRLVSAAAAIVLAGLCCLVIIAGVVSQKNHELATANDRLDQANQNLTTANEDLRQANASELAARAEAEAVLDFFRRRVLAAARPEDQEGGLGINATIRAAVDAAEPSIREAFTDQPLAEAAIRRTLGTTYFYLGEPRLAVAQQKRALELRKTHLGPQDEKTLLSMNELALAYKHAGDADQSFQIYEQLLESIKTKYGEDNPDTLTYTNNLGEAFRAAGRLDEALPLLKDTLTRRKKTLGIDHLHTLITMNNLALAIEDAGDRDAAIGIFEETLERRRKTLGPEHPHTLQSMNNLAAAYVAGGKPEKAIPLHQRTLELMTVKLGPENPDTLRSMSNLARGLMAEGEKEQAVELSAKTLELRRKRLGLDHPETLQSVYQLAQAYLAVEQSEKATLLIEQYITERRSRSEPGDPQLSEVLYRLADILLQNQQYSIAEKYLRECVTFCEKNLPDHWLLSAARSGLGAALRGQNMFEEAEPLLIAGCEGLQQRSATVPANFQPRVTEAVQRLIDLYTAWDKPDEAQKWRSQLQN